MPHLLGRPPRHRHGVCLAGLLAIAALAASSTADAAVTKPLPVTALAPAEGLAHPASNYPVATDAEMLTFTMDVPQVVRPDSPVWLEVASSPTPGQDGTLSDDNRVAQLIMSASDTDPKHYAARVETFAEWFAKPGKYYWVVHYMTWDLDACSETCNWVTPARSFKLTPVVVVLERVEAETQAALALTQRYGKRFSQRAIDVRIACAKRLSARVRRCNATWQRRGVSYRARLDIVERAGNHYAYRNAKLTTSRA